MENCIFENRIQISQGQCLISYKALLGANELIGIERVSIDRNSNLHWTKSIIICPNNAINPLQCLDGSRVLTGARSIDGYQCVNCCKVAPTPLCLSNNVIIPHTQYSFLIRMLIVLTQCLKISITKGCRKWRLI